MSDKGYLHFFIGALFILFSGQALAQNSADLVVAKSGPANASGGSTITYTLNLHNSGPSDAHGATFTDPLPAGFRNIVATCLSSANGASACADVNATLNISGTTVTGTIPQFPNGGNVVVQITAQIPTVAAGSYTNTATLLPPAGMVDSNPSSNTSSISTSVTNALLDLKATASGPSTLTSGVPANFTFTFTNQGILAADGSYLKIAAGSFNAGSKFTIGTATLSCTATNGAVCPSSLPATVNPASSALFNMPTPTFPAGSQITLTLSFTPTLNDLCISAPDNVGGAYTATATVPTGATELTPADNLASTSFSNAVSGPICPTATATKTGPASFTFGSPQQYDIVLTNTSGQAMDGYVISDRIKKDISADVNVLFSNVWFGCTASAGTTCPDFSGVGSAITVDYVERSLFEGLTVPTWPAGGTLTITVYFTATPTGQPACGGPTTTAVTNTVRVNQAGNSKAIVSGVAKTANTDVPVTPCPQTDLAASVSGWTALTVGVPTDYTITYTNNGPSVANGTNIQQLLFSEFIGSYGNLVYGQLTMTCTAANGATCPAGFPYGPTDNTGNLRLFTSMVPTWPVGGKIAIHVSYIPGIKDSNGRCPFATISGNYHAVVSVSDLVVDSDPSNNDVLLPVTLSCADLVINKQLSNPTPAVDDPLTYTITVNNSTPGADAAGSVLRDPLPEGFSYVSGSCAVISGAADCSALSHDPDTHTVSSVLGSLPAGASIRFTLEGTVAKPGSWNNTASVSTTGSLGDPLLDSNKSTVNFSSTGVDLHIEKIGPALYTPGDPISYTLTVKNFGDAVVGAAIEDIVPAGINNVTWTCSAANGAACGTLSGTGNTIQLTGDFPQGGTVSGTLTITVQGMVEASTTGQLVNKATVTPPLGVTDVNPDDNTATVTTNQLIPPAADLSISKSVTPSQYTPGATTSVVYTVTVHNAGPDDVIGATVSDTPPTGVTIGNWTCLASASSSCPASGTGALTGVSVDLLAGGSAVFTVNATVGTTATGILTNTVTVTPPADPPDPDTTNNQASANLTPGVTLTEADLSISKSATPTQYTPGTASAVTYSVVVTNHGPDAVSNALVTDTPAAGLTIGTWSCSPSSACPASGSGAMNNVPVNLAVGGSATFLVSATVNSGATGIQANTVTVVPPAGTTDPDMSDNTDTATVSPAGTPETDLQLTKTAVLSTYTPGVTNDLAYTITVKNNGPLVVTGATVTDTPDSTLALATWSWTCSGMGSGSCPLSGSGPLTGVPIDLTVGDQVVFALNATIPNGTLGDLVNSATVAPPAGIIDSNQTNNTDSATVTQNPAQTDLRIEKTASIGSYVPGVTPSLTYTVRVFNDGPLNVTGAAVNDAPLAGITLGNWTCTANGVGSSCPATGNGALNSVPVDLPVGTNVTFVIDANIDASASDVLTNTASISTPPGVTDSNPGNNSASVDLEAVTEADLSITKSASASLYLPGDSLTYTIVATNAGPAPVIDATINDVLPAGLTIGNWTCAATTGAVCPVSGSGAFNNVMVSLPVGGSVMFTINARVALSAQGDLINSVSITPPATITDNNPANNNASARVRHAFAPPLPFTGASIPLLHPGLLLLLAAALGGIGWQRQRRR